VPNSWPPAHGVGIIGVIQNRTSRGNTGERVNDLQIAWLIVGWLLAFWAGKDLQERYAQWRSARQPAE
jgi:hypothetical protein